MKTLLKRLPLLLLPVALLVAGVAVHDEMLMGLAVVLMVGLCFGVAAELTGLEARQRRQAEDEPPGAPSGAPGGGRSSEAAGPKAQPGGDEAPGPS